MSQWFSTFRPLFGTWRGQGYGEFPTIDPFSYLEDLSFVLDSKGEVIYFEQRAYLSEAERIADQRLHWESGVIRPRPKSDEFTLACVQDSGRIEAATLNILRCDDLLELEWRSDIVGNDKRMPLDAVSLRRWSVAGDSFRYTFSMSTEQVPQAAPHLRAELTRAAK